MAGLIACCWLAIAWPIGALAAADPPWPQVGGGATLTGAAAGPAPPYREDWSTTESLGGPSRQFGLSEPVTDGSTVVVVGTDAVTGLDLATGRTSWTVRRDAGPSVPAAIAQVGDATAVIYTQGFGDHPPTASPTASISPSPSPSSSPSPGAGAGSFDSHLAAFDLKTQEPLFRPVQLDGVSRTGVTVAEGTAFVGDNGGTVYAIDLSSGKVDWTAPTGGFLTTPLAVADGLVIASVQGDTGTRPSVVALHVADGSKEWAYEGDGQSFLTTSAAVGSNAVYVAMSDATVRAIGLDDGSEVWRARLNAPVNFAAGLATSGTSVFAVDLFGELYRLDTATGDRVWNFALNQTVVRSTPVVPGTGQVLVPTADGGLDAVAIDSGHLVWQSTAHGGLLRSLALTPEMLLGVRGGASAAIVAFRSDPSRALVDIVSPTTLNIGMLLGNFLIAAVPITIVLILGGGWLSRRMGPAFLLDEDEEEPGDPPLGAGEEDEPS